MCVLTYRFQCTTELDKYYIRNGFASILANKYEYTLINGVELKITKQKGYISSSLIQPHWGQVPFRLWTLEMGRARIYIFIPNTFDLKHGRRSCTDNLLLYGLHSRVTYWDYYISFLHYCGFFFTFFVEKFLKVTKKNNLHIL